MNSITQIVIVDSVDWYDTYIAITAHSGEAKYLIKTKTPNRIVYNGVDELLVQGEVIKVSYDTILILADEVRIISLKQGE